MPEYASLPAEHVGDLAELLCGWVRVGSESMLPWLRPGDEVALRPGRPRPGDIILVPWQGHLLLHRLLARDGAGLWLGGDATASWEGPFADSEWPVVVARRRAGVVVRVPEARWARVLAWCALANHRLAIPGGRRITASIYRRLAACLWPRARFDA